MSTSPVEVTDTPTDPVERFDMRANFEGLIQLLARNLYPEPDVFVRELIQNAHDSIRLRQEREPAHDARIEIEVRVADSEIVFRDNGLGMDREDIRQFLSVIGSTGTGTARQRLEDANRQTAFALIGQFGIGMLSAFVVAERVTVHTRKLGSDQAFIWENGGTTECLLRSGDRTEPGCDIVVKVARNHAYMLDGVRIREAIIKHCDFLPIPIYVDGRGPVNLVQAPWDRPGWPSEDVRDAAYRDFVNHRYPDVPLEVIPIEIEEPVHARGALYITDRRLPDLNTAGVVDIFVRRMFVRGADAELLPPWAKFVRGIVECPDLQPTAARDNVRRDDWAYNALRQRLAELIVERLLHLAKHKPDRFREINTWHHYHLKGMALFHEDFFVRVAESLLFETNRGLVSLADAFQASPAPDQRTEAVFFFSDSGSAAQFYRMADARGMLVINASQIFEKQLLQKFVRTFHADRRLVALDESDDRVLFSAPTETSEQDCQRLEGRVESALARVGLEHVTVQVRRFEPDTLPAVVLLSPESEAALQLQELVRQPWFVESLANLTFEVLEQRQQRPVRLRLNERAALIKALLAHETPVKGEVLVGLFLSAALNATDLLTQRTAALLQRELISLLVSSASA